MYSIKFLTLSAHTCMHEGYTVLCLSVTDLLFFFFTFKFYLRACSLLVLLGFQVTDFDKTVSFGRYSTFQGSFVVSVHGSVYYLWHVGCSI